MLHLHCGLLSLARCHQSPPSAHPPVPALLQCHADLASLWQCSAGPVTPSVPSTSPQDPCMPGVPRGRRWQQRALIPQPRGEHFPKPVLPKELSWPRDPQAAPPAAAAQIPLLSEGQGGEGWHHPHSFPWNNLLLSPSPERVPARGEPRAYPEGFWGGLLALAVCDRSRVEGWSWRRSCLLLLIRSLAGSSGFCGLRHRGGGLKSVTGHQQQVRGRMWAPTAPPGNGNSTVGTLNGVGGQGRERNCWKVLQQAQAGVLPSPAGLQEVPESTLSSCGQESPEHGPSTVGVPRDGA